MITADSRRCLGQAVADGIREATPDVELDDPVASDVTTTARGDDTHTQQLEFTATQRELQSTLTITVTYTRVGRGITLLYLQQTDDVVLSTGTAATARRLADALAD